MAKTVEFLVKEIHEYYMGRSEFGIDNIIEKAKQLEKQQMIGMYVEGGFAQMRAFHGKPYITAEQYYNETYNTK